MNDYPSEKNDSQIIDIKMSVSSRFINHSVQKPDASFPSSNTHAASISIFPTNACLIKLVGVGVETSNSYLHK